MDIIHDTSNIQLCKIADLYDMPDYVKTAEALDKESAAGLPAELFADQVGMHFPINNRAQTWLSAAYFNENEEKMAADVAGAAKEMILKAASIYNIDQDVRDVFACEKVAADDQPEVYYCYTDENGRHHYPVFGPEGVKKACAHFDTHYSDYKPTVRHEIARNIIKKAQDFGVEPSRPVMIHGGLGLIDTAALASEIFERAKMTKDAEAAAALGNLASLLEVMDASDLCGETEKIAEVMEAVDTLNGMDRNYDHLYWSPMEAICPMTVKEAEAFVNDTLELKNHHFSLKKLAELDATIFTDVLGEDFAGELTHEDGTLSVEKMAEILPTLPDTDKRLLEKHIVSSCEE